MARRTRYRLDRVTVEAGEARPSTWTFGGGTVSGTEQTYQSGTRTLPVETSGYSWSGPQPVGPAGSRSVLAPLRT